MTARRHIGGSHCVGETGFLLDIAFASDFPFLLSCLVIHRTVALSHVSSFSFLFHIGPPHPLGASLCQVQAVAVPIDVPLFLFLCLFLFLGLRVGLSATLCPSGNRCPTRTPVLKLGRCPLSTSPCPSRAPVLPTAFPIAPMPLGSVAFLIPPVP